MSLTTLDGINMRAASIITVLNNTTITVNLSLGSRLSGFTTNVVVIAFHPFMHNSFIRVDDCANAIARVALIGARVAAAGGRSVVVPGDGVAASTIVGCATLPGHHISVAMNVNCSTSVGATGRIVLDLTEGGTVTFASPRPVMQIAGLNSGSISQSRQ